MHWINSHLPRDVSLSLAKRPASVNALCFMLRKENCQNQQALATLTFIDYFIFTL